jgi:hypothetical protein
VLTDSERQAWREIQRRLVTDPDFARSVHAVHRRAPGDQHRPTRPSTILVAVTLIMLLLAGPNPLTQTEIAARHQTPEPRRSTLLSRPGADVEYLTGLEWAPAWEIAGLLVPTDTGTHGPVAPRDRRRAGARRLPRPDRLLQTLCHLQTSTSQRRTP